MLEGAKLSARQTDALILLLGEEFEMAWAGIIVARNAANVAQYCSNTQ